MTVSTAAYVKGFYDKTRALGDKAISSDFTFSIEGHESSWLLFKQAPHPELSPAGEIEVPGPLGTAFWQPQQLKVNQQGQVSLMETVAGSVDELLLALLRNKGHFNAMMYDGTPEKYLRAKRFENCFLVLDNPDRNWEDRSQILTFSGTLFFHYFGETLPGNSNGYE